MGPRSDRAWALGLASTCLRGPRLPLPYLFIRCIYLFIMAGECHPSLHPAPSGCLALLLAALPGFSFTQFAAIAPSSSSRYGARGGFSQVGSGQGSPCPHPACMPGGAGQAGGATGDWQQPQACGCLLNSSITASWGSAPLPASCTTGVWLLPHQQSQGQTLPHRFQPSCQSTPMMSVN